MRKEDLRDARKRSIRDRSLEVRGGLPWLKSLLLEFRFFVLPTSGGTGQVLLADLNGDKQLDFVGINGTSNSADARLGNGDGTFQGLQTYKLGGLQYSGATLVDVSGDGKPDLVAANWCCRPK